MYVFDPTGVTDPLLARLPPAVGERWQWGIERRIPEGYTDSLPERAIALTEPPLASLYEHLRVATRAPLMQPGRLSVLLGLPKETTTSLARSSYGPLDLPLPDVGRSRARDPRAVPEGGIIARFGGRRTLLRLAARMSERYDYEIQVLDGDSRVETIFSPRLSWNEAPDSVRDLTLDERRNVTALWFRCGRGTGPCTLSDVRLSD